MTIKFFVPDWEDRVDPSFDFQKDEFSEAYKRDHYKNGVYAHQIFENPPYDGILVSLSVFQSKINLDKSHHGFRIRGIDNIKTYLKINRNSNIEVMGDCGAFSYVGEKEPPKPFYTVKNVAKIYHSLGFDYGVSVDHLVVDKIRVVDPETKKKIPRELTVEEKDFRIELTLKNAKEFIKLWGRKNYSFVPIGVAQGYNIETYEYSVDTLINMGYEYIGLGGMVRYKTPFILEVLKRINPLVRSHNIKVHLFGVVRLGVLREFQKLGVTSFDSASFLRRAWLRSGQNYLTPDGRWYSAIRVPQSTNNRLLQNAELNGYSRQDLERMERRALEILVRYDRGEVDLDTALKTVLEYDKLFLRNTSDGKNLEAKYRKTLEDKPWKKCNCPICRDIGIHVLIFRGANRNKRRGFHNMWALRKIMKQELESDTSSDNCST